jgi:YD repeat-containing protein
MSTAYIWGYKGNLLVAEIKNATYQQVINVLGQNTLDALHTNPGTDAEIRQTMSTLRNSPALQKAMITTYTHKPAAGPSSVTDPNGVTTYYEYDSYNRLSVIKDSNGSILKTFDYHYKQ